ncbi:hypothetical protein [uncultured Erythrobacter sp.]|uniref:hypothetical protein n=1 Tax=uncultured Erythrobacter sp. TaxID=263913 RepID=UPI0026245273|nr:hypothetical protein [uncultured Erythrobacter sp.]
MGKKEILVAFAATSVTVGGGWMALADNPIMVNAGLAFVALGVASFGYLIFEPQIKAISWDRISSAIKARSRMLSLIGILVVAPSVGYGIGYYRSVWSQPDPPIVAGIPLERITGFYEDRTSYEGDALSKPFIGSKVTASGAVENVYGFGEGRGGTVSLQRPLGSPNVTLNFEADEFAAALRFTKGDIVAAECTFRGDAYVLGATFENCRLKTSSPPS